MGRLLFPHHPAEVLLRYRQQVFQLAHPVCTDVARFMRCPGPFQKPDGFLMVVLRHVQGVFEGGFVPDCLFFFHSPSVVLIPG